MSRRGFFAAVAALVAVIPGAWWWRRRSAVDGAAVDGLADTVEAVIDPDVLRMFVDTLVPADETPGAVDAGVADRMLARLSSRDQERAQWASALSALDAEARSTYGSGFAQLDPDRRTALLEAGQEPGDATGNGESGPWSQRFGGFVHRAHRVVIRDFYAHPVGQAAVGYRPPLHGYPDYDAPPPRLPGSRS